MRKTATYLFCIILTCFQAFGQVNLTNQLLLEYTFSGNSLDQSGNGVNATANGGPVFVTNRFGTTNSAYQFDGVDDYLNMNAATLIATEFSYSLWAFPTNNDAISALLSIGSQTENQDILLSFQDGWIGGSFKDNGDVFSANTPSVPALNKWYHIVVTRNNNLIQLYVNGDSISSMEIPNVPAGYGATPLANIGRRANSESQYYQGKIDDIRIYGRVINKAEVKALFQETEIGPQSVVEKQSLEFSIVPNPSAGDLTIQLPKSGIYEVELRNSFGELILSRQYSNVQSINDLDLQNKVGGFYFLTIKSSEGIGTKKIILSN